MNTEQPDIKEIFCTAIEKKSKKQRDAYLDEICRGDRKLRAEVEALLKAHDQAGSFLQGPAFDTKVTLDESPLTEGPGTKIARYKLLQLIGEGGFGVVYMAEQEEPIRRRVALKIIKLGMDTKQVIARFEAERQALAMMDHPNIARVLDAGATDTGRPYFVMELVKGIPITEYCDKNNLHTQQRLELFIDVCKAVQHAHQKGIIHRDIKPSNVMITLHDGKPVPKIIDFGIAKATQQRLTEKTLFTEFRQFIGTPEYMSPEQAEMSGLDVDTRSDIYSLGVLLYELLTGTTPFDAEKLRTAAYDEIRRIIREDEPPRPSTRLSTLGESLTDVAKHRNAQPGELRRIIRGDLDWVVMKALEKDRTRRYETASEFAHDIQRHLDDEPVVAGPPSTVYRLRKFIRRHRTAVVSGLLIAAAIVLGLVVSTTLYFQAKKAREKEAAARVIAEEARVQAENARQIAQEERDKQEKEANRARIAQDIAERQAYCATIQNIWAKIKAGDYPGTKTMLEGTDSSRRGWEWGYLKSLLQYPEWSIQANAQYDYCVPSLTVSHDGKYFITRTGDTLKLWNRNDQKLLWRMRYTVESVYPTKRVFDHEGRFFIAMFGRKIFICRTDNGEPIHTISDDAGYKTICMHPDGSKLYIGTQDGRVLLFNIENRKIQKSFKINDNEVCYLAMGLKGKYLASATNDHAVQNQKCQVSIHDPTTLEIIHKKEHRGNTHGLACTDNCETLIILENHRLRIYSNDLSRLIERPKGYKSDLTHISLSTDERYLTVGGRDGSVIIYDTNNWNLLATMHHDSMITGAEYLPDGKILTLGGDGTVKQWFRFKESDKPPFLENPDKAGDYIVEYRSDGQLIAKSGWHYDKFPLFDIKNKCVNYIDVNGVEKLRGRTRIIRFRPNSSEILLQTPGWLHLFDTRTEDYVEVNKIPIPNELYDAAFDSSGRFLAVSYVCGGVAIINLDTGKSHDIKFPTKNVSMSKLVFSGNEKVLAVWENVDDGRLILVDIETNSIMWELDYGASYFNGLGFHPDGDIIAIGSGPVIALREVKSGKLLKNLYGHLQGCLISSLKFSPDGTRLLSSGGDKTIRLWDWKLGKEILVFNDPSLDFYASPDGIDVCFSPDGMSIANYRYVRTALPWIEESKEDQMQIPVRARAFKGHHYLLYESSMNWKAANSYCESIGAHLAAVTTEAEMTWIRKTFDLTSGCYWLGGTDQDQEGVWSWVTGEKWQYSFWSEGEPNNYRGIEHALEVQPNGRWNDNYMEKLNYFLIEWDQ